MEHSLRLVDIVELTLKSGERSSVFNSFNSGLPDIDQGSSDQEVAVASPQEPVYTFHVILRTYWVNN